MFDLFNTNQKGGILILLQKQLLQIFNRNVTLLNIIFLALLLL